MKLIIAGSRTASKEQFDEAIVKSTLAPKATELISGGCPYGVDDHSILWAYFRNIKVTIYPPDWAFYGKAAGPIRNAQMAEVADALLAIWDGVSKGTLSMINIWKRLYDGDESKLEIIRLSDENLMQ